MENQKLRKLKFPPTATVRKINSNAKENIETNITFGCSCYRSVLQFYFNIHSPFLPSLSKPALYGIIQTSKEILAINAS